MDYDFIGWATKNGLKCADGRTIMKDAFKRNDGMTVPLVWNHLHNDPLNVLGHALLKNRNEGVIAYCSLNDTESGLAAKEIVKHGDVVSLSIYANKVQEKDGDVYHGDIKEVSLVLAGANPGAKIETIIAHGEDSESEVIFTTGEEISEEFSHADEEDKEKKESDADDGNDNETVRDVLNSLNEKQSAVVMALIEQALEAKNETDEDDKNKEENEVKHNVFEKTDEKETTVLSHADMQVILGDAKRLGSLREAVRQHVEDGTLVHSIPTTGMTVATGSQTYGFNDAGMLFPDYKSMNNPPEWISRNMDWVSKVMGAVHHTPFSRIKSVYADITENDARARGYIKGTQKKEEVFTTLKRTTDPQTVYKKQKMDRDDIIDITDFDVVAWIRAEMRVMLNEELARAFLIGDGRASDSDDKIQELHIRPIMNDVPLFNTKVEVTVPTAADDDDIAKTTIRAAIKARKDYKGSGNPTFFTTEDVLTDMLLLEDNIGHKLYKSEAELATALRVKEIVTVEPMENQRLTVGSLDYPLIGIIVNLADYNVGADKGGEINMFDDFDIDYNQFKYLIETRISGALVKPFSALTLYLNRTAESSGY